jgi:hypothetical protein
MVNKNCTSILRIEQRLLSSLMLSPMPHQLIMDSVPQTISNLRKGTIIIQVPSSVIKCDN